MRGGGAGGQGGSRSAPQAAFTLVELLVVLVVLGVVAGVSATALPSLLRAPARPSLAIRLAAARRQAVLGGHAVSVVVTDARTGATRRWRLLPDGRALGPGLDPRDGAIVDTTLSNELAP
jgi:prepilin-type N-terminal cleavage/methylation domain-containing protein